MMTWRIRLVAPVSRLICVGESPSKHAYPGDVLNSIGPMAPALAAISSIGVSANGMSTHCSSPKGHPMWTCQRMLLNAAGCCIGCREARHAPLRLRVTAWSTLRRLRVGCCGDKVRGE